MTPGWTACVCPPAPASFSTLLAPSRLGGNQGRSLSRAPAVASRENRRYQLCRGADPVDARSCFWPAGKEPNDALDSEDDRHHSMISISVSDAPRCARPNRRCPHRSPPARTGVFQTAVRDDSSTVAPRFPSAISDAGVFHSGDCAHVRGGRGRLRLRSLPAAWNCQCASAHCFLLHTYNSGHLDL